MSGPVNLSPSVRAAWTPPAAPMPCGEQAPEGLSFQGLLQNALTSTAAQEQNSQQLVGSILAGDESVTQVEVLTAVKKADLSLRMMLQIRNTLMDAYNEVKAMQF